MSNPTLTEGSRGPAVAKLAAILKKRSYLDATEQTFNRAVRRAVEEFQARHVDEVGRPLVSDGVVGPLTWWALETEREVLAPPAGVRFDVMPARGGSRRGRAALEAAIAETEAGAREIGRNNSGPFVKKYLNGKLEPPANWCAGFVSWCFAQHPAGIPFRYTLGARDIRNQFQARGWLVEDEPPEPGDIIAWWRGQPLARKGTSASYITTRTGSSTRSRGTRAPSRRASGISTTYSVESSRSSDSGAFRTEGPPRFSPRPPRARTGTRTSPGSSRSRRSRLRCCRRCSRQARRPSSLPGS